jgi:hypothetical protein
LLAGLGFRTFSPVTVHRQSTRFTADSSMTEGAGSLASTSIDDRVEEAKSGTAYQAGRISIMGDLFLIDRTSPSADVKP